ncbi:hypothetical protein [Paenibacillus chitinolyticus]|uniref:Ribokinase n=1 Tax=Paenibacillus chitinolyticus TaxID=79263 RepID=A0ABT4FDV2_9BACL|nr:hypothetical protein [Paenibacillus chitinolyticus]MCY9591175.1 hypothetical protein [Paenibacillus chitinolyticus]MCY9596684.1 hypothetical protein [Paenibacillus chitinolyticus]
MNRPAKIAVAGSINMDLVVTAERLPIPGETVRSEPAVARFRPKGRRIP